LDRKPYLPPEEERECRKMLKEIKEDTASKQVEIYGSFNMC
jgi:hypothetical protein